jgi:DNA-binding XRE family transcriptional regulator
MDDWVYSAEGLQNLTALHGRLPKARWLTSYCGRLLIAGCQQPIMREDGARKSRPGLKTLRQEAEITQAQLAHAVGVAEKAVRSWENDGAIPSFDKAVKLARVLGVSLKRLAQEFDLQVQDIPDDSNEGGEGT